MIVNFCSAFDEAARQYTFHTMRVAARDGPHLPRVGDLVAHGALLGTVHRVLHDLSERCEPTVYLFVVLDEE